MLIEERQKPAPGQALPLSTERIVSHIPKGEFNPDHQEKNKDTWEYPSEQMFYNAMKRKGYKPKEQDMSTVVAIHNHVNNRT